MSWSRVETYKSIPIYWNSGSLNYRATIPVNGGDATAFKRSPQDLFAWIDSQLAYASAPTPPPADIYTPPGDEPIMAIVPYVTTFLEYVALNMGTIIEALKLVGLFFTADAVVELVTGTQGLTSVDDIVQEALRRQSTGPGGGQSGDWAWTGGTGDLGDPKNHKVGTVRSGWEIQKKIRYEYGRAVEENKWYKPYKDPSKSKVGSVMNFSEKCAYYQGMRVQVVTGKGARNRAYWRGVDDQYDAQHHHHSGEHCAPKITGRRRGRRR